MKKYILINIILFLLNGCSLNTMPSIKVAKIEKSNYDKKYTYVIEQKKSFSSAHGSQFPKTNIMHFYIYTNNTKGKVEGNEILWGIGKSSPKQLSKNSTFIFDKAGITIHGLQNCDPSEMCFFSDLNGKHIIVPLSKFKNIKSNEKNIYSDFTFK